jgi:hypothetical protein
MTLRPLCSLLCGLLACCACSSDPAPANTAGSGGVSSGGAAAGAAAVTAGQSGALASGGTIQGGASGGAVTGGGGGGASGGALSAGGTPAGGAAQGGGGPGVQASCANNNYPLCLDFETGIDKAVWTNGTDSGISTADKAHGEHSYHAYKGAGVLTTTKFGAIKDVLWGRFYLRMTPGAPGGHGNIVGAYQGGNWYELGWQFNGLMGVWHYGGGERPLRSHPAIVDKCTAWS